MARGLDQSAQVGGGAVARGVRVSQHLGRALELDGEVLTLDELAIWLRLDVTAKPRYNAWRYLRRHAVPVIRDGRKVLVRLRDVQAQRRDDTVRHERKAVGRG
jgi:hypothetical protein